MQVSAHIYLQLLQEQTQLLGYKLFVRTAVWCIPTQVQQPKKNEV